MRYVRSQCVLTVCTGMILCMLTVCTGMILFMLTVCTSMILCMLTVYPSMIPCMLTVCTGIILCVLTVCTSMIPCMLTACTEKFLFFCRSAVRMINIIFNYRTYCMKLVTCRKRLTSVLSLGMIRPCLVSVSICL